MMKVSVTWTTGYYGSFTYTCLLCNEQLKEKYDNFFSSDFRLVHVKNSCVYAGVAFEPKSPTLTLDLGVAE